MLKRQTSGTSICFACNQAVPVETKTCPHCGQRYPGLWGYADSLSRLAVNFQFIPVVTWGCIGLYGISLLLDLKGIEIGGVWNFLSPSPVSLWLLGASGAIPFFENGRWWTLLSAEWLHGHLLHLAFNLAWFRYLALPIAQVYGSGRLTLIYIGSGASGCLLSSAIAAFFPDLPMLLQGASLSVGASGGIFGLLGALTVCGQRIDRPALTQQSFQYAIVLFLLGFVMPSVDNWGHLGGFLGGYGIAQLPWFDPRRPQTLIHWGLAIAVLLLAFVSLGVSVLHGLMLLSGI